MTQVSDEPQDFITEDRTVFERRVGLRVTVVNGHVLIETPGWMDADELRWLILTAGPAALDALER